MVAATIFSPDKETWILSPTLWGVGLRCLGAGLLYDGWVWEMYLGHFRKRVGYVQKGTDRWTLAH
jgi:hypothetical protein